ncbi:MAG: hybrid sensor histidine kinase/response regulator [Ketobacter sp.]|nr:MAG: hybrid sensor histidine kinase/response regulator [Ketobacter sp.]
MQILLVEDNSDHAELICDVCEQAFSPKPVVHIATRFSDGVEKLLNSNFDLALWDLQLPDSQIADTIKKLKNIVTPVPIVVLTSLNDTELSLGLIRRGIQDYMPKEDLTPPLLQRVCYYAIDRKKQHLALEKRNQDQQLFCQSLSHDFNSPIRNINQLLTLLKDSLEKRIEFEDHEIEFFDLLDNRLSSMSELVHGLYEYLLVEADHINYESIDLNILIKKIVDELTQADEKQFSLEVDELPKIAGLSFQYYILFKNLISNAIKYNVGAVEIKIRSVTDRAHHHITVSDNGIGINPKSLNTIFQPFSRLLTDSAIPGAGLGLSIVTKIIENHQGTVSVTSELGRGSEFTLSIPRITSLE